MRKKIKGFTLVELIAVIVILSIILLISVPSLIGNINNKKQVASNQVYALIKSAAKNYEIDYDVKKEQLLAIEELCERYISCPIIDPYTNEEITGYITIGTDEYRFLNPVKLDVVLGKDATTTQVFDDYYIPYTTINMIEPTRQNSKFLRWEVIQGNSVINDDVLTIGDTDTMLYALWEYYPTLTVDLGEGASTTQEFKDIYKSGEIIELLEPTRPGYTFERWSVSSDTSVLSGNTLTIGSEDVTLTALWSINTYTITYSLVGGTKGSNAPESGTYGSTVTVSDPTRTNWSFIEWVVSGTGASMNGTSLTIGTGNVTLTARYKTNFRDEITRLYDNTSTRSSNSLDASDPDSNIRYTGTSPKNYVTFNGETWRIVGVFEMKTSIGNTEKLVKIVRNSQFTQTMSWDSSASDVNGGYGVNEWSQSDLMTMLNTYYIGTSETCSYCSDISQETCLNDCSSSVTQIESTYASMIEEVIWNTGAITYADSIERSSSYEQERGTTEKICSSGTYCTDGVERTTTWAGKVGLIYPSDYGYASTSGTNIRNSSVGTTNWLETGSKYWTISPGASSSIAFHAWCVVPGFVGNGTAYFDRGVRPAIYLKSNISITDGDGTSTNPYILSVD